MTHPRNVQTDSTTIDQPMELLTLDGPDALAQALTTLLNHAMRCEREQARAGVPGSLLLEDLGVAGGVVGVDEEIGRGFADSAARWGESSF